MKKNIIIAALLLLALGGTQAQDTVVSTTPKSGYFYNTWLPPNDYYLGSRSLMQYNGYVHAIFFYTPDTLDVYGIGVSLETVKPGSFEETILVDTSWKEVYEYLGLYKYEGDTLRTASDSLYVHLKETPISYYYKYDGPVWAAYDSVSAFYERYFDEPVQMTDTFLVGMTMRTHWVVNPFTLDTRYYIHPVFIHGISPLNQRDQITIKGVTKFYDSVDSTIRHQMISNDEADLPYRLEMFYYPLIFPILTPPDTTGDNPIDTTGVSPIDTTIIDTTIIDTTTIDTTSVGIGDVQVVGRYVSLLPNPATDRVKVYNAAGARVREVEARGYTATLRVDDLPEGAYLLRIHTPAGNTTKKLIVRR